MMPRQLSCHPQVYFVGESSLAVVEDEVKDWVIKVIGKTLEVLKITDSEEEPSVACKKAGEEKFLRGR
ncbi:hypothetical protein DSCW_06690 [Desulfosarcina widdelii]|uniref:Uncharacterized protein n=1 Tax=Desulfosarcina widdelii TaxID=947919 RepID=A0A5K7YU05_9BACT|nr:hypothetical protein [Desulfosarcina widdelii]BBO73252.1 hypothetical protein DSCW_06690 [Desulfosarcina widdelii]